MIYNDKSVDVADGLRVDITIMLFGKTCSARYILKQLIVKWISNTRCKIPRPILYTVIGRPDYLHKIVQDARFLRLLEGGHLDLLVASVHRVELHLLLKLADEPLLARVGILVESDAAPPDVQLQRRSASSQLDCMLQYRAAQAGKITQDENIPLQKVSTNNKPIGSFHVNSTSVFHAPPQIVLKFGTVVEHG